MARKPTIAPRLVDLLLRKSQVVRGTSARDILSLKAQETRGRSWAKRNGYEVRQVFRENLSAYKAGVKRPDFDAAVHALLEGESDCLWTYDSSRYSRKGAGDVLKVLDNPGKRLVFDLNGLDTEIPEHRERIIHDAERDRTYSRVLSEKVRDTKAEQRDAGKWLAIAPYGLKATKKRKLKGNKSWPMVERIHNEAATGKSLRDITTALNTEGVPSPRGGEWRTTTVGKILRNPVYLGWQTVTVKGAPQVYLNGKGKRVGVFAKGFTGIPQETWNAHRRLAVGRASAPLVAAAADPDKDTTTRHPAAGIVWCAGGGFKLGKGHRAVSNGNAYRCGNDLAGIPCTEPCTAMREGVHRVLFTEVRTRLAGLTVPGILVPGPDRDLFQAVAARWQALQHPDESNAETDARAQLKVAQEAVKRLDRLNEGGAYGGRDGEATFIRLRRAAVDDVEEARKTWEAVTKPPADFRELADPVRFEALWKRSDASYQGALLRVAISHVFIKKAEYVGQRITADRLVIVWASPDAAPADPMRPPQPSPLDTVKPGEPLTVELPDFWLTPRAIA